MSIFKKLGSQAAIYGLSSIVGRLINWALTPLYAHFFTLEEFGMFSDLYAMTFFPLVVLTCGMETSFFHFAGRTHQQSGQTDANNANANSYYQTIYARAFFVILALTLVFGLIAGGGYKFWANILGYALHSEWVLILTGIIIADTLAALPLARLRYEEKAKKFISISLFNIGLTLGLNLVLVIGFHAGLTAVLISNLIASGLRLVWVLWGNQPHFSLLQNTSDTPPILSTAAGTTNTADTADIASKAIPGLSTIFQYGFFIMLAGFLGALNETFDRNLLPRLWGEDPKLLDGRLYTGLELNGIYSAMYKIGMFISLATQAFRYAAEPFFFRQAQESDAPVTYAKVFHYYTTLSLIAFLFVASLAPEIVGFQFWGLFAKPLIPKRYWVGLDVVPIILMANVFLGMYVNLSMWYKVTGQLRFGLFIAFLGACITIIINAVGIPDYGYYASAWATLLCYGSMTVYCYYLGKRRYPIPYKWGRCIFYGIWVFIFYQLNAYLSTHAGINLSVSILKLLLCLLCCGIIYYFERNRPLKWRKDADNIIGNSEK